jgi:hypothetical protein
MNDYNELVKEVRPTSTTAPGNPSNQSRPRSGLFLKLPDFKVIEKVFEELEIKEMTKEEKDVLWKVKTIIHNIESARLR